LALSRTVSEIWPVIGSRSQNFPTTLSFRALDWGDPYGSFRKALQVLKLGFLPDPPEWQTDGQTDRRTELRRLRRAIAVPAVARNYDSILYTTEGMTIWFFLNFPIGAILIVLIVGINKLSIKFKFSNPPKGTSFAQNRVVWRIERQNPSYGLACRRAEGSRKKKSSKHSKVLGCIFHVYGEKKNPEWIEPKFCLGVDVRDAVTWFKFGGDRLRGLGSAEGKSLPFPIDFDGRPYNTLTLPWYGASNIPGSRPWPFGVRWRHPQWWVQTFYFKFNFN